MGFSFCLQRNNHNAAVQKSLRKLFSSTEKRDVAGAHGLLGRVMTHKVAMTSASHAEGMKSHGLKWKDGLVETFLSAHAKFPYS